MQEHPDRETLRRFITGELHSDEARPVERHLSLCLECRDRTDQISAKITLQLLDSWLRPSYEEALDRAADRTAERLAGLLAESPSADDLLGDLLREPFSERRRRIANDERFHSASLCKLLWSGSREAWFSDPAEALRMADLAVEVAIHLDSGRYGSSIVEDSRALAWAYLANAFRITSDLGRAEQALHQACLHHMQAGEDPYTEAEILGFTASLRRDQSRYLEAIQLADARISIYREAQDRHLVGAAMIHKSLILGEQGRPREAIAVLRAGLDQIDPDRDPRFVFSGNHNLALFMAEVGAPGKAQELLEHNRPLYRDLTSLDLARVRWLEGTIAGKLGQFGLAEKTMSEVRDFFLDCDLGIEVFLTSLDLAQLFMLSGKGRQVKETLSELIPLGAALDLRRETMAARVLYEQASRA